MHEHRGIDDLLLSDGLDLVLCLEVQFHGVADVLDGDLLLHYVRHARLEAVPLGLVLFAACGDGQAVTEHGVIGPQRQFPLAGVPRKEVQDGGGQESLAVRELGRG